MLILKRGLGEKIVVQLLDGRLVEVQVVRVWGGKVRLGVTATKDVRVLRDELLRKEAARP